MDWRLHMDLFCHGSIDLYKAGVVGFLYADVKGKEGKGRFKSKIPRDAGTEK